MNSTSDRKSYSIVIVSQYFSTHLGGLETVAAEIGKRLAQNHGHSVEWIASDCDASPFNEAQDRVRCSPQPCWNFLEANAGLPIPIWSIGAYKNLSSSIRACDAVHIHDFIYPGSLGAILLAKWHGKPILITQHIGWIPYKNPLFRLALWSVNRFIGGPSLRSADRVVIYSDVVRHYFSRFVNWRRAPSAIANGTDSALHKPAHETQRQAVREELGVADGRPVLLFVGRFVEKKGLPLLKKIVEAMPEVHWWICGHGPLHPGRWNLPQATIFERPFGESLCRLYQAADLLVLPSRGEGFPLVVQESMACGTPVLISTETAAACPEAKEVLLAEACTGDADAERWVSHLRRLISTPDKLQKMRGGVAGFSAAHWSWDHTASEYARTLDEMIMEARKKCHQS